MACGMDDIGFMTMALSLARQGWGFTSPNPMVGALVVKDGQVVGQGFHQAAGGPHAEVHAIDDAGPKARGATLYVTLEPCNHTGRTPPCTEKILASGIAKVVVAMGDPNPHVTGDGNARLRSAGIPVVSGVCETEARRLNEAFVTHTTTGRPFVLLKCAMTLDGRIATRTGDARWVTGKASRQAVHRMRHGADAILVGIGTIRKDDPSLTTRLETTNGKDPQRVILDPRLTLSPEARVLRLNSKADTIIAIGPGVCATRLRPFRRPGVQLLESQLVNGRIDLAALIKRLGQMHVTSLLIEGGARVIASVIRENVADKACFFYAPKILGGDDGVPVCRGPGPERMKDAVVLTDISVQRFEDDVMIEGYFPRTGNA